MYMRNVLKRFSPKINDYWKRREEEWKGRRGMYIISKYTYYSYYFSVEQYLYIQTEC